jgi:hypothetical protein
MERSDAFRQLEIVVQPHEVEDSSTVSVFAAVSRRGVNRRKLLLSVAIAGRLTDLNTAQTLYRAGQILQAEAFRMAQPAPQAPRGEIDQSGRVLSSLDRFKSLP